MSTIVTRAGKGSPLTNTEVDANFVNLNAGKLELSGGTMTGAISFAAGQAWPTFNQNTTGTAAGLSATLAITSGGTGATTVAGAQTNLQVDPAGTAVAMAIALG